MKKSLFGGFVSTFYNLMLFAMIAILSGLSFPAVAGVGYVGSMFVQSGGLRMAVQKEIWMTSIVEGLFADNSFLSKAFNADEFVKNGKTVHIPNAGAGSKVVKNRTEFPATVSARGDLDLTFDLDEFTTDPIKITNAESVELSYNKRESVLKQDKAKLIEEVSNDFIYKWSPAAAHVIRTSGAEVEAHAPDATGNRLAFTKADVKKAMTKFNKANVPQTERYMLIDADMHDQLLESLTEKQLDSFNKLADVSKGVIGQLYSFNIMMRSKAGLYTDLLAPKLWSAEAAATDCAAALAWHMNSVCRSLGETEMFDSEKNPLYYADIYSFLVRAGGRPMRNGVEGLVAIVQGVPAPVAG